MSDINSVALVGRLTRDAEIRYTSAGTAVSKLSIANNTGYGDKKQVNFFNLVLWGKTAESLNQYLKKGKQIAVRGELRQNKWEQDGQTRSTVEINVSDIQLLGSKEAYPPDHKDPASPQFEDDIPF